MEAPTVPSVLKIQMTFQSFSLLFFIVCVKFLIAGIIDAQKLNFEDVHKNLIIHSLVDKSKRLWIILFSNFFCSNCCSFACVICSIMLPSLNALFLTKKAIQIPKIATAITSAPKYTTATKPIKNKESNFSCQLP